MICKKCGKELPENAKFCLECGTKVEKELICASCGMKLPEGAKFCLECGTPVGGTVERISISVGEEEQAFGQAENKLKMPVKSLTENADTSTDEGLKQLITQCLQSAGAKVLKQFENGQAYIKILDSRILHKDFYYLMNLDLLSVLKENIDEFLEYLDYGDYGNGSMLASILCSYGILTSLGSTPCDWISKPVDDCIYYIIPTYEGGGYCGSAKRKSYKTLCIINLKDGKEEKIDANVEILEYREGVKRIVLSARGNILIFDLEGNLLLKKEVDASQSYGRFRIIRDKEKRFEQQAGLYDDITGRELLPCQYYVIKVWKKNSGRIWKQENGSILIGGIYYSNKAQIDYFEYSPDRGAIPVPFRPNEYPTREDDAGYYDTYHMSDKGYKKIELDSWDPVVAERDRNDLEKGEEENVAPLEVVVEADSYSKAIMETLSPYAFHSEYYVKDHIDRGCEFSENNGYLLFKKHNRYYLHNKVSGMTKFVMNDPDYGKGRYGELYGMNNQGIIMIVYDSYEDEREGGVFYPSEIYRYDFSGNLIGKNKFNPEMGNIDKHGLYIYGDYVAGITRAQWYDEGRLMGFSNAFYFRLSQDNGTNPVYIEKLDGIKKMHKEVSMDGAFIYLKDYFETADEEGYDETAWTTWFRYSISERYKECLNGVVIDLQNDSYDQLYRVLNNAEDFVGIAAIYPEKGIMLTGLTKEEAYRNGCKYSPEATLGEVFYNIRNNIQFRFRSIGFLEDIWEGYNFPNLSNTENPDERLVDEICYFDGDDMYCYKRDSSTVHIDRFGYVKEINLCGYQLGSGCVYVTSEQVLVNMGLVGYQLLPKNFQSWAGGYQGGNPEATDLADLIPEAGL